MIDTAKPSVGKSIDEIVALYRERRGIQSPLIERMRQVQNAYNGDIVIPLPEMDRNEQSSVANLISMGLDQTSMRISSTMPSVFYPPLRPGIRDSEEKARTRTRATMGWWETNDMELKLGVRARKLLGYSSSPVLIKPNMKKGCAQWMLRDPLSTYPSTPDDPTDMTPDDVIFTYERNRAWLRAKYPDHLAQLARRPRMTTGQFGQKVEVPESNEDKFTMIEYHDAEVSVLAVLASEADYGAKGGLSQIEVERTINRTGMCLVVAPGRLTLDRPQGQYDGVIGIVQTMAELMALELIAVKKGVFPDMYLESRPNETAQFTAGPYNGRTGMVNIVKGGTMREIAINPGYAGNGMLDRLERNARVTAGVAPEMGGESQTNVRTGKRGDAILSAVVDFPVQETQKVIQRSLEFENHRAVAIAKTYFGNEKKSFYISTRGKKGHVDYIPNKDFESDQNVVNYPHAGADANGLITALGQRVSLETISKRTTMEIDPMVDDPELEHDRIIGEGLEKSLLNGIEQQVQTGQIVPVDVAQIIMYVVSDKMDFAAAVKKVDDEAKARQAAVVQPGAPEAQPGLAVPGAGGEQPTVQAPNVSTQNLAGALASLRATQGAA